jgi:hypothetical protein
MRLATLYTLPKETVKTILENNLASMKGMKPFTQIWQQTQNVVDICNAIVRSPVDDESGN